MLRVLFLFLFLALWWGYIRLHLLLDRASLGFRRRAG